MAAVTDTANPDELPGAAAATASGGEQPAAAHQPGMAGPGGITGSDLAAGVADGEPGMDDDGAGDPDLPAGAVSEPDDLPADDSDDGAGDLDLPAGAAGEPGDLPADDSEDGEDPDGEAAATRPPDVADLEQESEIAADYVEGLLDVADLDGDIDMDVEGDRALVSVVGATLSELVGRNGEVLEALQELTRLAVHRQTGVRTRIMLDVGGYRARRRVELTALGQEAAEDVGRTGVPRRLDPMTPFERKIVHDAVAAAGLRSESEGEEPDRRVVVLPGD
jgi:spoIIIJ-associated protein